MGGCILDWYADGLKTGALLGSYWVLLGSYFDLTAPPDRERKDVEEGT